MKSKVFVSCCLIAAAAMGQVSHVVPPGTAGVNPSSPFNSWETAATNIQEAVNAAAGQEWTNVWVSNGTYTLTGQVEIAAAMTVRSWHDGALDRAGTIVNGGNLAGNPTSNRCFYINRANFKTNVLKEFRIQQSEFRIKARCLWLRCYVVF